MTKCAFSDFVRRCKVRTGRAVKACCRRGKVRSFDYLREDFRGGSEGAGVFCELAERVRDGFCFRIGARGDSVRRNVCLASLVKLRSGLAA